MTAGLPGSGIGGIYYLCLVLWMPLREGWRTLRGRGSLRRWRETLRHLAMATGILASLFMASMGAQGAVLWMTEAGWIGSGTARTVGDATGVTSETAAFVGFAVLATVLLGSWLLARLRRRATGP